MPNPLSYRGSKKQSHQGLPYVFGYKIGVSLTKYAAYMHIYTCCKGHLYKTCLKRPKMLYPKVAFSAVISPGHTGMILSTINHDCNSHGELL